MSNPWFRMYAEFAHDPKVQMLSESMQRRYIMIMCMRCSNADVIYYTEDVAWHLRISLEDAEDTRQILTTAGLIEAGWRLATPLEIDPVRPPSHVWRAIRDRIFARDDYTCQYCGERGKKLECDHVVAVAKGGSHDDQNLTTACIACNRSKRDKSVEEWRAA